MSSTNTSLTAGARLDQDTEKGGKAGPTPAPFVGGESSPARRPSLVSHFQLVFNPAGLTDEVLGHSFSGEGTTQSPYLVSFLEHDPQNPMAWSAGKRWMINILSSLDTFAVAFASSVYTGGFTQVREEFLVSQEVAILGVSLFVLGFAIGPFIWAPASEFFGRQPILFLNMMFLTVFGAGAAGANSMATLLVLRALAGSLGCGPLTNSIGVVADMFSAEERGLAAALFCLGPFLGPSLGPVIGGFLSESEGWRWVEGLIAIFGGVLWILSAVFLPETYAPVLLSRRAAKLSAATGKVYVSHLDRQKQQGQQENQKEGVPPPPGPVEQFRVALLRPWVLLFREPIVFLTAIYIAVIYGTLYMLFTAFPIVFEEHRGWSTGVGGLAFLGITVGLLVAVGMFAMFNSGWYARVLEKSQRAGTGTGGAPPEARLPPAILGSVLLPVGLFWFAWTDGPGVHWAVPVVGSGFFACGLVLVFLSLTNYLIDSYVIYAASVLAANTVLRSLFGCAFPLFTTYIYDSLGIHWAASVPAFLALGCMPFPYLFWRYGRRVRMRCRYSREAAEALERMGADHAGGRRGAAAKRDDRTDAGSVTESQKEYGRERGAGIEEKV